ncbi:MAG: hypothetical protein LBL62_06310 [Planctomycetaceae bacterium]|nr:hypothetical protein [Planctomycetaceae bacterium]
MNRLRTYNLLLCKMGKCQAEKRQQNIALIRSDTILWTGSFPPTKVVHYIF